MPTVRERKQAEADKLAEQREQLQEEHGLSEAEADLVLRRTGGGQVDIAEEVAFVISERVGPAAGERQPDAPVKPRLAPNVRLDDLEVRIAALEQELARLRRAREVTEPEALRLSRQGVLPDEPEPVVVSVGGATQEAEGSGEPPEPSLPPESGAKK